MKTLTIIKLCAAAFVLSSAAAIIFSVMAWRLPPPEPRPDLHDEPLQKELSAADAAPFTIALEGHTYAVQPRFSYHLTGLVVSMSDAMGWKNITHREAGDFLNTNDLCVIWGSNAETLDLSKFTFTHGDWTCYVSTSSAEAWSAFRMDGLSNNHILPATPEISRLVHDVRIGDQIEIDGDLVDYTTDGHSARKTSIVRTDTGNGACEIIYVTGFRFIQRHHLAFYRIARFAMNMMVASLVALGVAMFLLPFFRSGNLD